VLGVLYEHFDPQQCRITINIIFTLLLRASVAPEFIVVTFLKGSVPPQKKANASIIDPLFCHPFADLTAV